MAGVFEVHLELDGAVLDRRIDAGEPAGERLGVQHHAHELPRVEAGGVDVRHRALDAERVEVGDAGDHGAARHHSAFLRHHPGEDAGAVRPGRGELEQADGVVALLAQGREVELDALELRVGRAAGAVDGRLELGELDLGLLRLHLGRLEALLRDEAVGEQLAVLIGAIGEHLGVELLALDLAAQIVEALLQAEPELLLLVGLPGELVLDLFEAQAGGGGIELEDLISGLHRLARPLEDLLHPRLDGARKHSFERRDHGARSLDDPLDGPAVHRARPDLRPRHGRPQPSRQEDQNHHAKPHDSRDPSRPAAQAAISVAGVQFLVHDVAPSAVGDRKVQALCQDLSC